MSSETVIGMHGEGFHWPFVLMIVILVLAIMGIVFLTRYFSSPVDVSTLGSAKVAIADDQPPDDPPDDIEHDTFVVIPDISGYTRFMQLTRFAAVAADECKYCVQYKWAVGRNHARKVDLRGHYSRHNPAGTRKCFRNILAFLASGPLFRPRHYRAARCSDAAARTGQPGSFVRTTIMVRSVLWQAP